MSDPGKMTHLSLMMGLSWEDARQLLKVMDFITGYMAKIKADFELYKELESKARCTASCLSGRYAVHPSGADCPLHGPCVGDRLRAYVKDGEREVVQEAIKHQGQYVALRKSINSDLFVLNRQRENMSFSQWRPEGWDHG